MRLTRKTAVYFLVCLMVICAALPVSVSAAQPVQTGAQCTLTITYQQEDTPVSGAEFELYRVAEITEGAELIPTGKFAAYGLDLGAMTDSQLQEAAQTLLGYAQLDQIVPDVRLTINEEGSARADALAAGLYLISGGRLVTDAGVYSCTPMLVSLPIEEENGAWNYILTIQPKASFEPKRETVDRKVLKVWNDKGLENSRPKSIKATLMCDGKAFETVELNAENNWRWTWTGLDAEKAWTIVETPVAGYTATHATEGITTVITNTPAETETEPTEPTEPEEPELPKTGMLWWPVPLMAALGLVLVIAGVVQRRGSRHEA